MHSTPGSGSANIVGPQAEALHAKFSALVFLLSRCLEINVHCHILADFSYNPRKVRPRNNIMDEITTILVLNHEIIAAALIKSPDAPSSGAVIITSAPAQTQFQVDIDARTPPLTPTSLPSQEQSQILQTTEPCPEEELKINPRPSSILNIAAVPNPDIESANDQHSHRVTKIEQPENHWPDVKKNAFMYLLSEESVSSKKSRKVPQSQLPDPNLLSDHTSILSAYLNDFRHSDVDTRPHLSATFTKYLISRCWRKLLRRFENWPALGLLHELTTISKDKVEAAFRKHGLGVHIQERKVIKAFDNLSAHPVVLDEMVKRYPFEPKPELEELDSPDFTYNATSAWKFHQFFCAILFIHARLLAGLKSAIKSFHDGKAKEPSNPEQDKKSDPKKDKKSEPQQIALFLTVIMRALTTLVHSSMLKEHLHILEKSETLKMPTQQNLQMYLNFGQENDLITAEQKSGALKKHASLPSAYDEGTADEAEDGEDDETDAIMDDDNVNGETFRKWMKVFVGHFSAKRKLEEYCIRMPQDQHFDVQISLIAVTPAPNNIPSWDFMEGELKELAEQNAIDSDDIIKKVKDKIAQSYFAKILESPSEKTVMFYNAVPHCEAILASLAEHSHLALRIDEKLRSICQNIDRHSIFVSKLCCPVCWELMKVLQDVSGHNDIFNVRGRHATLCPVQLPRWLPLIVMEKMIDRFRLHTVKQLQLMGTRTARNTHNHSTSKVIQSNDAVSTASISSGSYTETDSDLLERLCL